MISAHLPQRRFTVPVAHLLGLTIAAELTLSYASGSFASNLLCDLALIAAIVAANERRDTAMLPATGLACGLAHYGVMLLPLSIGLTIGRRVDPRALLLVPLIACIAAFALDTSPLNFGGSWIGLWAIVTGPSLTGLLVAIAIGGLAWLTATLSSRLVTRDMMPVAGALCALEYALFMPGASLAAPLAFALRVEDRRISLLTGLATLMAILALPIPATLTLAIALALVAKSLLATAANDNQRWRREPPAWAGMTV